MSDFIERESDDFFQLRKEEVQNLQDYIKQRNTAILVIMFTDLKGFTQLTEEKGDRFSNHLRQFHDQTMQNIIEENHSGKIIKFIGDAVMAVFSEPTQAVDRALAIQREFRDNLQQHPELGDISVRIGLHMGQVAIDNSVKTDIFGRHVNRAARIEGLADGGQIFLTYPVFDSAKGWMAERPALGWARHGSYQLKGIADPIEVIEAYDTRYSKPARPQKAKKSSGLPSWLVLASVFGLGILLTVGGFLFSQFLSKPEVFLYDFNPGGVVLNGGQELFLEDVDGSGKMKLNNQVPVGKNALSINNGNVLYFYAFELQPGANHIRPKYTSYRMPEYQGVFDYSEETPRLTEEKKASVVLLDDKYQEITQEFTLKLDIGAQFLPGDANKIHFLGNFQVVLPSQEVVTLPIDTVGNAVDGTQYQNTEWKGFYQEDQYALQYQFRQARDRFVVEVRGRYLKP